MRKHLLLFVSFVAVGCQGAPKPQAPPARIDLPPKTANARPSPAAEDPFHEWHDRSPRAFGPFYQVAVLNFTAPSVWSAGCGLSRLESAVFLGCGGIARVDGARIDVSFPSPSGSMTAPKGRWPDDLWSSEQSTYADGMPPKSDPFRFLERGWWHYDGRSWSTIASSAGRSAYVDGSSAFLMLPATADPDNKHMTPACADYSCLRVLPRVFTSAAVKPDFAALKDKIAWIHLWSESDDAADYAHAIDPEGPVYVAMRALDLRTNKKGFGLAKWTPRAGATFEWLPAPYDAKESRPTEMFAKGGKVSIAINVANNRVLLEHDGTAWKQSALAPGQRIGPPETWTPVDPKARFFQTDAGKLMERTPTGEREIQGVVEEYNDAVVGIETLGPDDTWVFTRRAVFRTIKPPEVVYRTEPFGQLHPWPGSPLDGCTHPFVVIDAQDEKNRRNGDSPRKELWHFPKTLEVVELEVYGITVIGVSVANIVDGEKVLEATKDNWRPMAGTPHEIVCARPVGAKPFVEGLPD